MRNFKFVCLLSIFLLTAFGVASYAGSIRLKDGVEKEGRILVRNNVATVVGGKLFQFPLTEVENIKSSSGEVTLISKETTILEEPETTAKIIEKFDKGLEVKILQEKGDWIQVRGWGDVSGWMKKDILTKEVVIVTEPKKEEK